MYLDSIVLTRTLPCLAEPGKIIVIGKPSRGLEDVLPHIATLPGVIAYNPETLTLTFQRPHGFMTLYPDKVYITQVKDSEEGLELLQALTEAINATWERREELTTATAARRAPRWLDILTVLPQTNCKQCGEETCLRPASRAGGDVMSDKKLASLQATPYGARLLRKLQPVYLHDKIGSPQSE